MESKETKYERARKRVKEIKNFYTHLGIYLFINTLLQLFYTGVFDKGAITDHMPYWVRFTTPFFWGLSVLIHGLYTYKGYIFKRWYTDWEDRKIRQLIKDEDAIYQNKSKWE